MNAIHQHAMSVFLVKLSVKPIKVLVSRTGVQLYEDVTVV